MSKINGLKLYNISEGDFMRSYGLSDTGLVRKINEDAYLCEYEYGEATYFIVADGMGGRNAGEVASSTAIDYIKYYIENYSNNTDEVRVLIKNAILYANEKVYKKSILNSECVGMGTTLSLACILREKLLIGHVGDSRVYLVRDSKIIKLTEDHSLVEELVKNGTIKPEEANSHPQKNIITRALGTEYILDVDLYEFDILDGDFIALCTDGLSNMVTDEEILDVIRNNPDANIICERLIVMAKESGGFDNITVIIIKAELGGE